MKVRRLNTLGRSEYKKFVNEAKAGSTDQIPDHLLSGDLTSDPLEFELNMVEKTFASRYEMGVYLVNLLENISEDLLISDYGMWDWFSLKWFGQICPIKDDILKPSMDYNYILSDDYKHRSRHAIYITWQLVSRYQEDARFILSKLDQRGDIAEQLMGRQEILTSEGVMRLASKLYFDPSNGSFKRGAAGRGGGSVRRYVAFLQQLEINYYIESISKDQLISLLPAEFQRFNEQKSGGLLSKVFR
tara:strand:+ start:446 stop:1180 length:735 start_codon:yes stop_codon:yes gene_type:complete